MSVRLNFEDLYRKIMEQTIGEETRNSVFWKGLRGWRSPLKLYSENVCSQNILFVVEQVITIVSCGFNEHKCKINVLNLSVWL